MNLDDMPLLRGLINYADRSPVPFHMPGHKGNLNGFEELDILRERLFGIDKTEVPGLDNLHAPEGIILEAEMLAARAYKAKKSYFLVNGSTCGIYSMIMGVTKPSDKIIVQRNCHRSVYMAAMLGDLEVKYIDPEIVPGFNIPGGLSLKSLTEIMDENPDAKAVVLTNPSYYGICSDMEGIVREAHRRKMLVLVDEAHGAHLPFSSSLPKSSMEYGADAAVVSVHKSLPALTQASLLNLGGDVDVVGIEFMLRLFQSTSPSYVLMASLDAARHIAESRGEALFEQLVSNNLEFREKLQGLESFKLLDEKIIGTASIYNLDLTKLVIGSNIGGKALEEKLRKEYNIQVEMSDVNNVVLISGIGDNGNSFIKLYDALYSINNSVQKKIMSDIYFSTIKYNICLNMKSAYYSNKKSIDFNAAEGYISGEMLVPYPPGIPILLPGELITKEIIDYVKVLKGKGINLTGMNDPRAERILVIEN